MVKFLRQLPLIMVLAVIALAPEAAFARRVALVIGVGAYPHAGPLANPANDARAVTAALRRHGFAVTTHLDLGKLEMVRALQDFREQADGSEKALVYFAGHGIEIGGENWLLPADVRLLDERDIEGEAIRLGFVMAQLGDAHRLAMVVLDACRDNPFARSLQARGRGPGVGRGLARVEPPRGESLIAFAAAAGAITPDGPPGGNSPFTEAFVEALDGPPRDVRLLMGTVRDGVRRRIGQQADPAVYSALGGGEVVINRAGLSSPTVSTPAIGPRVWRVSPDGAGDHRSVAAAVAAARAGDRIELLPGHHRGGVVVDKPLEIVGVGIRSSVVWEATGEDVVRWTAASGRIANMTITQRGGGVGLSAINITGSPTVEYIEMLSESGSVVIIFGERAEPILLRNTIRDGNGSGIFVANSGRGRIESNQIHSNAGNGVTILSGGELLLVGNTITRNSLHAISIFNDGRGRIIGNDLRGNMLGTLRIQPSAGRVTRRDNRE